MTSTPPNSPGITNLTMPSMGTGYASNPYVISGLGTSGGVGYGLGTPAGTTGLGQGVIYNYGNLTTTGVVSTYSYSGTLNLTTTTYREFAFQLKDSSNQTLLDITNAGEIRFHGKPSKAARQLVGLCQYQIDEKTAGVQAMQRSYRRAVEKCLKLARTMEKDQLIELLEQEINVRLASEMMMLLKEKETE